MQKQSTLKYKTYLQIRDTSKKYSIKGRQLRVVKAHGVKWGLNGELVSNVSEVGLELCVAKDGLLLPLQLQHWS